MNPWPLIPISLAAACIAGFAFACYFGTSRRRGVVVGVRATVICAYLLAPASFALLFGGSLLSVLGRFLSSIPIMGTVSALLAIPCGAAVGLIAAAIRRRFWGGPPDDNVNQPQVVVADQTVKPDTPL